MSLVSDRAGILETIRHHPRSARKLWLEGGYEQNFQALIDEARNQGIPFKIVPREQYQVRFKGLRSHVCLEKEEYSYPDPSLIFNDLMSRDDCLLCALDGIQDPQNLGNILRSGACLGVDAVVVPKDRSCPVTDAVIRVSRGGIEHVPLVRVTNLARFLDEIRDGGVFCYGLDESGGMSVIDVNLTGKICLVLGGEEGMRRLTRSRCDALVTLPTSPRFSTMNAATALALALYEAVRQRRVTCRTTG